MIFSTKTEEEWRLHMDYQYYYVFLIVIDNFSLKCLIQWSTLTVAVALYAATTLTVSATLAVAATLTVTPTLAVTAASTVTPP